MLGASSFQCRKVSKAKLEELFKGTYPLSWPVRVYLLLHLVPVTKASLLPALSSYGFFSALVLQCHKYCLFWKLLEIRSCAVFSEGPGGNLICILRKVKVACIAMSSLPVCPTFTLHSGERLIYLLKALNLCK